MTEAVATRVRRRLLALPGFLPGYARLLRRNLKGAVSIAVYHGVARKRLPVGGWCQWCHIDAARFETHIRFLAAEYRVLHLEEILDRLDAGRPLPERAACVTFDDGFLSVATTAFPILQRYQVPATVFLVTGQVESGQPAWPERVYHSVVSTRNDLIEFDGRAYSVKAPATREKAIEDIVSRMKRMPLAERAAWQERLGYQIGWPEVPADSTLAVMGWAEIQRLAQTGLIHFGSHTKSHPILSQCPPDSQRRELLESRDALEQRGLSRRLFAYPNGGRGDFTGETKSLLAELGYRCAVTTIHGLNRPGADRYELKRIGIGADATLRRFQMRMAGF